MKLHTLLAADRIQPALASRTRDDALREMAEHTAARAEVGPAGDLLGKLLEREKLGTTAIGAGVAIPHCKVDGLRKPVLSLGLSQNGIPFASVDGEPAHAIFLVVSPQERPDVNLRVLALIAKLVRRSNDLAQKLLSAGLPDAVLGALQAEEDRHHG